jgi:hypothetical protein
MSERKVINKYIPPDFDPDKILPRGGGLGLKALGITSRKAGKTVRVMLPFSVRCDTCEDYVYKGTKFNARKETCSEKYLSRIPIYRFYIKCPSCYADITYKTDPQNADYAVEQGCTRNQEPWRQEQQETKAQRIKREFEEKFLPLKAVENKAIDSKREIDMMESLERLQAQKTALESASSRTISLSKRETPDDAHDSLDDGEAILSNLSTRAPPKPEFNVFSVIAPAKADHKPRLDPRSIGIKPKRHG